MWEAATGKELARITHDEAVTSVAFSPDGRYVVSGSGNLLGSGDTTARVWEAATGRELARMTHDRFVLSVAFSPDGKYVISGGSDGTARVWEAMTGREVARMIFNGAVTVVAFSPDGKYVVSGVCDRSYSFSCLQGSARVWSWQADNLIFNACAYLPRNLTRAEWEHYISSALPYQAVCPNLPIEPEITATP